MTNDDKPAIIGEYEELDSLPNYYSTGLMIWSFCLLSQVVLTLHNVKEEIFIQSLLLFKVSVNSFTT